MNEHLTIEWKLLIIKALAPGAAVKLSQYTQQWYIEASIEIGNSTFLTGITEHHDSPADAINAFFDRITNLDTDKYVATTYRGHRREWRWNGAAFSECTRDVALPELKEPVRR